MNKNGQNKLGITGLNMSINTDSNVNETYVMTNERLGIVIVSGICISERLYQHMTMIRTDELKKVQKHIRLVCDLILTPSTDKTSPMSHLAVNVPTLHNTTKDIVVLSKVATHIHEIILDSAQMNIVFDNIEKDLKNFYDE